VCTHEAFREDVGRPTVRRAEIRTTLTQKATGHLKRRPRVIALLFAPDAVRSGLAVSADAEVYFPPEGSNPS
jgi:hypothetical protein